MRAILVASLLASCAPGEAPPRPPDAPAPERYDVLIRGGTIYDGSGSPPVTGDVAIRGDRLVRVGAVPAGSTATLELEARGLAVAPGFVNVLSHAEETLIHDGKAQSDVRQGVTLEILGEGSMGPITEVMKKAVKRAQRDIRYELEWDTLGQYLAWLEKRGISVNVASLVGAGTVRENVIGLTDRPPTPDELERMKGLVAQAMDEGALGLTSALIYTPDTWMTTDELVALAEVAAQKGGIFTAHMRNEGDRIEAAIDEMGAIARRARIPVEIYHLKLAGKQNWPRLEALVKKIESLRARGLRITADMYPYTAAQTGFDAGMPRWAQAGGYPKWAARLRDPKTRARVKKEMLDANADWDNFYAHAGPDGILLAGFKNPELRPLLGRRLAEVARERGVDPADLAMDLVVEDGSRIDVVYFLMSEENVRRQIALPWMSFCSDAAAQSPAEPFASTHPHPRAYGSFARLLGTYVREEKAVELAEAIRRMTSFPAATYGITDRGRLAPGAFADAVVFDPATVADRATFEQPHRYATGVRHVLVNGQLVVKDGEHTGATPGRAVRRGRTAHEASAP